MNARRTLPIAALLLAALLQPAAAQQADTVVSPADPRPLFRLDVQAPEPLADYIGRHAELRRFETLGDLSPAELDRLLLTAPEDVARLLGALGYFSPDIRIERMEAPYGGSHVVRIAIDPGPQARISSVQIALAGDAAQDEQAQARLARLRSNWALPEGHAFTQQDWDEAKNQALRAFAWNRWPQARIAHSQAEIDAGRARAELRLEIDPGPAHRFGALRVTGTERYDDEMVQRLLRLAGVRPGVDYDEGLLQAAQQRLLDSGYFESAFVLIDPDSDPQTATVEVRVREARLQKAVIGVGASTDRGPRLSIEHLDHRLPGLDWRAASKLQFERQTSTVSSQLNSPVNDHGWRWLAGTQLQRQEDERVVTTSQQLRAGRSQDDKRLGRQFYLQYDRARVHDPAYPQQEASAAASANYGWTRRTFDDLAFPTRGDGLAFELGTGLTLMQQSHPYLRGRLRWLRLAPLNEAGERPSRWALRLEGGAVWSRPDAPVPATQRFLAGGEGSVRGYGPRDIGVPRADGGVDPGRLLAIASAEWQRPLWLAGQRSDWEATLFVDAGAVADRARELAPKVGVGAGLRFRSPVGPLQADLAYGVDRRALRLHFSVGFVF